MKATGKEKELLEAIRWCGKAVGGGRVSISPNCNIPDEVIFERTRHIEKVNLANGEQTIEERYLVVEVGISDTTCDGIEEPYLVHYGVRNGGGYTFHQCATFDDLKRAIIEGLQFLYGYTESEVKRMLQNIFRSKSI